jgi:hypothetical protein
VARMPGTIWLGEHSPRNPMVRYDIMCVHTIVGLAPAHAAHFSVKADGTILQSRDTAYQSAGNLHGNPRIIVVENEDHGPRFGGTPRLPEWVPLTPEQVQSNADIFRWCHDEHGIPLQMCPDSKPTSRGLAYHRQGIDGNFDPPTYKYPGRVPGGEVWTLSRGKVCPTDVRIAQLPTILELAKGDDDMEYKDWSEASKRALAVDIIDALLATDLLPKDKGRELTVKQALKGWKPNPEE